MRIAILGASHWHVRLMYVEALQKLGEEIVALGECLPGKLALTDGLVDCPSYTDYDKLIAEQKPDFVFAHAPHADMTALADWLVERRLPFHMEKPMGVDWRKLEPVATMARTEGVFASVALVSRYYAVVQWLRERREQIGRVNHYYYRLFAGDPGRYREWGVEWMLDPARAGAGPLFNFGPHVVDLFFYLCVQEVTQVSAHWTRGLHGEPIEDLCSLTMVGAEGEIGVGEVSYSMPEGYERYFSLDSANLHCGGPEMGDMTVYWRDGRSERVVGNTADDVYFSYTKDTLERFRAGQPPVAGMDDMVKTLRVLNAARESAQTGQPVRIGGH
ncbi:Gfo/Idh/MocA family oxidoreductase [bacterium]|nr:Gfo/Idh/MocA family oxidoreductase [bacterium]